jgi:hypothetical protein
MQINTPCSKIEKVTMNGLSALPYFTESENPMTADKQLPTILIKLPARYQNLSSSIKWDIR